MTSTATATTPPDRDVGLVARLSFTVTRTWRYEGYEGGIEESLILVDGQVIGGVYYCQSNPAVSPGWGYNDGGQPGESWASYGPRGLSCGHRTREAAERAQVREYVTNPDLYDRLTVVERAGREAEQALRQSWVQVRRMNAKIAAARLRRHKITARNGGVAPTENHNAATYTNWRCRCPVCCDAWNTATRKWKTAARNRHSKAAAG